MCAILETPEDEETLNMLPTPDEDGYQSGDTFAMFAISQSTEED